MSVSQFASDSLPRYIADGTMRQKLSHNRYGVLAQMAQLDGSVTLNYSARNWKKTQPRTKQFSQIRLLVGKTSDDFSATLKVEGIKDSIQYVYDPSKEVNVLKWQLDSAISNFKLTLSGKAEIYGVAIDGRSGVAVDNIPLRGSSGTFFHRISPTLLAKSMDALNVRMILLEFGGNATPYVTSDESVEDYKQMIARQIKYLKTHYPKAQVLLIGPADMSMKIAGELQTYPFLEEIVSAMEEAALENGAYFWNMYQVMGGRNSMVKWVEHQPAWAASDYIHFTETGANKIAGYFVQSFMNYYDYYQFLKRNKEWSGVE
jgi:lysophospholipase L1-like esterase